MLCVCYVGSRDNSIRSADSVRRHRKQLGVLRRRTESSNANSTQHFHHQPGHIRPDFVSLHAAVQFDESSLTRLETGHFHVQVHTHVLRSECLRLYDQHHRYCT